jgi:glutathione synthase/RimK-type ligase-like ATP-grasp enzyme
VFVINGKAVGAMKRYGSRWVSNVAQGGSCEFLPPTGQIAELAVAAARAVGIAYCGVDIIRDCEGRLYVLEVNGIPAWKGLQGALELNSELDIAQALADDFLARLNSGQRALATGS